MNVEAQIVPSSGNVFADLGFAPAEAQAMATKADLMIAMETAIGSQGFNQSAAPAC